MDDTPAKDKYADKAAELWFAGKEMLRHEQLFGLAWPQLVEELIARRHTTTKGVNGNTVVKLENKKELRKRTGKSPDIADAMAIVLDVIRERGNFKGAITEIENDTRGPENFTKFVKSRSATLKANQRLSTTRVDATRQDFTPHPWMKKQTKHPVMVRLSGR